MSYKINVPNLKALLDQLGDREVWVLTTTKCKDYQVSFMLFVTAFDRKRRILEYASNMGYCLTGDSRSQKEIMDFCDKAELDIGRLLAAEHVKLNLGIVTDITVGGENFKPGKGAQADA